jgi:phosphatidylglycerol:prolipoprotein diacylglycerol transferase
MIAYIIWDINPKIFEGFEFFRWYGLCWVLGIILGDRIVLHLYKQEGVSSPELDKVTIYVMLGAIVGARFGHILFYDPVYYFHNPIEILPFRVSPTFQFTGLTGLASHGGILGALLALYFYTRKYPKDYLWLLDRLMIGGAILGAFIRLGNLMNSEIIGTPSALPWAFVFQRVDQTPRHPAQLYEAMFYMVVSIVIFFVWKSKRFDTRHGFIFGLGITLIFTQRFLIEFLKENQVSFEENLNLNMGQALSIPFILGGIALMIRRHKRFTN